MPGPNRITWWRAGGYKIDFVVPSGGWDVRGNYVLFFDADNEKATSMIALAPGEAIMRWEEPQSEVEGEFKP